MVTPARGKHVAPDPARCLRYHVNFEIFSARSNALRGISERDDVPQAPVEPVGFRAKRLPPARLSSPSPSR
jgi:hypothetical protein